MSDSVQQTLIGLGLAFGIIGALYATYRRFHPGMKRASAALDAIVGKEAVTDRSGQVIEPGQPGLVHRVATVEEAVVEFRHVIALYTETQKRIDLIDDRVKKLEESRLERLVTRAESAQMWRAVADNAISDADVDPSGEL